MATQAKIDIKSAGGTTLLSTSINEGAKGYYSLMQHDYIVLPFKLRTPIDFKIGSYVDLRGVFDDALGGKLAKMYYVTELQNPSYNTSTGAYEYQLRLNAYYWLWNNFIFKYTTAGEASWSLTAPLDVQLGVFLRNLSELGFTYNGVPYEYSIDSTVENKAVAMTYDNTRLLDALFSMGGENAWDCDVWVTENVIHFGRCEHGDAVKIEIGVEASDMTRNESRGTFATRIYAFGSTRNIPENYRENDNPDLTVNGIVQKRLMLPADTPYIDAYPDMQPFEVVESVVVFDDIYPKRIGTLSDVKTVDRAIEDGEGNQTGTFKAYQYKDTGLTFDEEYILEGQELRIVFQSGKLNGLDFGVTFNPNGSNPAEQLWEIVANEDYGRRLPDEVMKPENGDKYILYGFDIKLVSDQYVPSAEQELKERAQAYVNMTKVYDGTYTVPLRASYVREDMISRTYDVGQKVSLVNPSFFGEEGRISRVIGWEMCLDIPSDNPVYTIGESAQYSRLTEIEDKVDSLVFNGQTYQGGGSGSGTGVYIIKTNDSTPASDTTVFSALRTLAEIRALKKGIDGMYLRKDIDDTAHGVILFDKKIGSSEYIEGWDGIGWEVESGGAAEFDSLRVRHDIFLGDRIGSASFVSGFPNGTGWQIGVYEKVNAAGVAEKKYKLEIDDVSVRGSLRAYEFIISQMRGENDNYIFAGMMKVDHYDPETRRIYLDTEEGILYNPFRSGDIIMVQRYGGMPTEENDYNIIKQYELRVDETGIGSLSDGRSRLDWITFTNFTGDLDDIVQGDILVRVDSVSDSTRKGVVTVTTINETGAPYIDVVYGMKTDPENATKARMGNLTGIRTKNGVDLTGVWGIYGNGAYFENTTIVLDNGNTVEQQFSVLNGRLESIITEIDSDMSLEDGNILVNSSFSKNTDYWVTDNEVSLYSLDGAFLWDGDTFMSEKGDVADIYQDGSRYVLRIRNSSIKQLNSVMDIPVHSDTDEEDEEYTYSFSLYYRALSSGTLSVGMEGTELYLSQQVEPSEEYAKLYKSGVWNEKGDFVISCTGEVLIYAVSLFTDELANAVIRLQTQITQNAEEISLRATKEYVDSETGAIYSKYDSELSVMAENINLRVTYEDFEDETNRIESSLESQIDVQAGKITANTTAIDNINDTIETAGWITTAEGNTLYAAKSLENGNNIVSYINQSATSIKISASRVNLTGAVTMSMLNSSLQNTINNAAGDAEDALSQASTAYSQAQSAYNRANSAYTLADNAYDRGDSAYSRATTAINNAASALNAANAAQQDINDMPEWSKEASIIKALEDATIIVGGYIAASYIDTDNLVAKRIESATGSFRSLDCVDNSGNKMGNITFDTGGRIWFNSCDLQHQGTKDGRTLRFLSSDIWCRGQFAAGGRITARVLTNTVYYYHSGTSSSYSRYIMPSKSYNRHTYYTVPCYGESIISGLPTAISGMPIDTIVFKMASTYYYELDLMTTQRVFVYNGNDSASIHIFINGTDKEVSGGMGLIVQQMPSGTTWMSPSIGSVPGAYQLISGEYDNNW